MPKGRFLCILLLLVSISTSAQIVVRLKEEAEVAGPQILLGELGEIQGEQEQVHTLSQTPVGVAPRPGESRTVHLNADLAPRLRRAGFRPEDFIWEGPQIVRVTGKIDPGQAGMLKEDLKAQLLAYLGTHPEGQDYRWQVEIYSLPSWATGEGRLIFRRNDLPVGNVTLRAEAGQPARSFSCQAEIKAWGSPLLLDRDLASGSKLDRGMVKRAQETELTSLLTAGKRPLFQLEENLQLLWSLPGGTILTWEDVDYPLLVRRGDPVIIFVEYGSVQVMAPGQALADGRLGERIRVMNTSSERIVEGVVEGEGLVKSGR
jgi:flagella basal body P-ring formation protein FlgA